MARTLDKNPDAIVLAEIFPLYLREAGSSAAELLSVIEGAGLSGWEIRDYRISPIAPGWVYDQFIGRSEENLVLCRNADRLAQVLSQYFSAEVRAPMPSNYT